MLFGKKMKENKKIIYIKYLVLFSRCLFFSFVRYFCFCFLCVCGVRCIWYWSFSGYFFYLVHVYGIQQRGMLKINGGGYAMCRNAFFLSIQKWILWRISCIKGALCKEGVLKVHIIVRFGWKLVFCSESYLSKNTTPHPFSIVLLFCHF